MPVKLDALIKKTEAAIVSETDPRKRAALQAKVAAFAATKAEMDDDGDEDDKKEDDEDEESKAKKAAAAAQKAKKAAEAAKHRSKAAEYKQKAEEAEEAAKKAEEDDEEEEEEEEEKAAAAAPGLSPGAAAALASQSQMVPGVVARLEALEKAAVDRERSALIADAKASRRIHPREAKDLATKSMAFVKDFLSMRKGTMVPIETEQLSVPDGRSGADIGAVAMAEIEKAVNHAPNGTDKVALTAKMVEDHRARIAKTNGAQERY